jgi:hypothetical protein
MPEWISVEDRLPEDGTRVLCWYQYYHYGKEAITPEYGIGYYWKGWGGEVACGKDCKVLYWMPLPEPPKGGQDNDGNRDDQC